MQRSARGDQADTATRARELAARSSHPDSTERYRALEEARRLPAAVRADVARHFLRDTSIWVRTLAETLLEPPRGIIRRRPALLHELDLILRGTPLGVRQRASLARLLEDAQALGSTGDLALTADRASRLVTQALSELNGNDREPILRLQTFLRHVASYAKPVPLATESAELMPILAQLAAGHDHIRIAGEVHAKVNREAVVTAVQELLDNAWEARAHSAELVAARSDSVVTVTVENSGAALTESEVSLLFRPWFTTKEGHAGLGLYLANVALAEAGGDLQLVEQRPVIFRLAVPPLRR